MGFILTGEKLGLKREKVDQIRTPYITIKYEGMYKNLVNY